MRDSINNRVFVILIKKIHKEDIKKILQSSYFEKIIFSLIVINSILIGLQVSIDNAIVNAIQSLIQIIFIIEILLRWIGRDSTKLFITNKWILFDIFIVLVSITPLSYFSSSSTVTLLRLLRVLRIVRLFKAFIELQLMVRILILSIKSVAYALLLQLIFLYIYSIVGVTLFKDKITVVTAHTDYIDPFGSISEAFFSLFRVTTGEDWTDLRYDLMNRNVDISPLLIDTYYLSWYILSAFLLINIVFGAIINNYETIYNEKKEKVKNDINETLLSKISFLESKIDKLCLSIHNLK